MNAVLSVLVAASLLQADVSPPDLKCGSQCLYVSLKALDFPVGSFAELEAKLGQPSAAGYSMGQLSEAAKLYGAEVLGVETTFENLRRRPGRFACIALISKSHFVNFADVEDQQTYVIDPPRDYKLPLDTLRTRWDGKALLISHEPLLSEEDLPRPFPRWILFSGVGILVIGVASLCVKRRFVRT